ncbi:MAG: hypothetical protein WAM62_05720 [Pseudolabrys sp.]
MIKARPASTIFTANGIPLLFVQFRRSDRGPWVFGGYVASCLALLAVSTLVQFVPGFSFTLKH